MVAPQPNQDVRPIGFDIPMGSTLADKGNSFNVYERFTLLTLDSK